MLTDIWFTPGNTFANFWFSPGLGWRGPGRTPYRKISREPPAPGPVGGGRTRLLDEIQCSSLQSMTDLNFDHSWSSKVKFNGAVGLPIYMASCQCLIVTCGLTQLCHETILPSPINPYVKLYHSR